MKICKTLILVIIFSLVPVSLLAGSYYYTTDFSSMAQFNQEWKTNWKYGFDGLTADPLVSVNKSSFFASSNGQLYLQGAPYQACVGSVGYCYNGYWTAYAALFTNEKFSASATQPFGFEILRTYSKLDANSGGSRPYRFTTQLDIWLVQDDGSTINHRDTYPGFICLYENARNGTDSNDQNGSFWGFFDGTKHWIDFSKSTNAYGQQINLTNHLIHSLNWPYDYWNTAIPNTNHYGIKIVHDGQYISMYINPDPDDNDAYPNEYCLVARREVLWNDNLTMILGHEVRDQNMQNAQDAHYDYLKIKSAANKSKVFLEPPYFKGDTMHCQLFLSNDILSQNAGINYVELNLPAGVSLDSLDDIAVKTYFNGKKLLKLQNKIYKNNKINSGLSSDEVGIFELPNHHLALILGTQIVNNKDPNKEHLFIDLNLKMSKEVKEGEIQAFVENRQFDAIKQSWNHSSTCGLQKCTGQAVFYRRSMVSDNSDKSYLLRN